uniref:F-box domain-containing protein n=1 Tax=Strongyloides papillosus TaxID=174720 RepID=A0A0N5BMG0_STREA
MNAQSDYPTFPITLLPKKLIKVVLEKVDWRTLYNLRLVSKFFNTMIQENFNSFDKPKVNELYIDSSHRVADGMTWVKYSIRCELGEKKLKRLYSNEDEVR